MKELDNKMLEDLMTDFAKDQIKEKLRNIVPVLARAKVLVPATMPPDFDKTKIKGLKQGEKMELPKGVRPAPVLLQTADGGNFFGVYTSKANIPKDKKFPLIMEMSFIDCCKMTTELKLSGVVVNAFSQNLTFKKPAIDAFVSDFGDPTKAPKPQQKQIQMTPDQFHAITRRNIEQRLLPKILFEGGKAYVDDISEGKEELICQIYADPYEKIPQLKCPYEQKDFSIMALEINDELTLVRIDLPEKQLIPGLCARVYVTLNPQNDQMYYFTIEKSMESDNRMLGIVRSDLKYEQLEEAPVEGAELQRIMDLVEAENKKNQ